MRPHYLRKVFEPQSVAVVGASERPSSIGTQVLRNLLESGYQGEIYAVNPKHAQVQGLPAYATITDIDHPVDLVVIAVTAPRVAAVLRQCAEHGVAAAIVPCAGFAEAGKAGIALQNEIVDIARTYDIPLVGPNCLGVMRPRAGLNATFARSGMRPGEVALVAQSGAFCTALLDWADANGFGFSALASLGATADVGFGDVLDYLATDPATRSILLHVEGIADARSFLGGLRVAARLKPVIVVKSGRHGSGTRAALSHTGAMVGRDEVFDAAVRRAGAVRVATVSQLFAAARTLASGVRVEGERLAIVTNGGGPGVMAADRASDLQVPLAALQPQTLERLAQALPDNASPGNPVDLLHDADAARYEAATRAVLEDPEVDGALVLLAPLAMTDATACAEAVTRAASAAAAGARRKPVLACWMGQALVAEGRQRLGAAGIPTFPSPEGGVDGFGYLASYRRHQASLLQAPATLSRQERPDIAGARLVIEHALGERRNTLTIAEAKAVLRAFHIPTTPSVNVNSAAEALVTAQGLGLPVAMKINSPDIRHKSDVGGVRLNIDDPHLVRTVFRELMDRVRAARPEARIDGVTIEPMVRRPHARELMTGIACDPVFGPVISFGTGGVAAAIFADRGVALPPLNEYLSRELIGRTRADRYLRQFRNLPPANTDALVAVLQRISEIACELPEVQEMDVNPLLVDEDGVVAVDARIVVRPPRTSTKHYGHMAIHPYPPELETTWQLPDGTSVRIRPIRPEDADMEQDFVQGLSEHSRYMRFMRSLDRLDPLTLARFTQIDYDREMALVAVIDEHTPQARLLGVVRYVSNSDRQSCEFALTVADAWQRRGIGRVLMQRLMNVARDRGIDIMEGEVLKKNAGMLRLCERLGFRSASDPDDPDLVQVRRHLA